MFANVGGVLSDWTFEFRLSIFINEFFNSGLMTCGFSFMNGKDLIYSKDHQRIIDINCFFFLSIYSRLVTPNLKRPTFSR